MVDQNRFKMGPLMNTKSIMETLTNDQHDYDVQLEAIRKLKKFFKNPDKIFTQIKLEFLLKSAGISLQNKTPEKDFLYNYGRTLVNVLGRNSTLDAEILHQLEYVFTEIRKKDENICDELVAELWMQLEKGFGKLSDWILDASKLMIERTVLEWVNSSENSRMEFFSGLCASSPKLFQNIASILYEVLVKTKGSEKVFNVTSSFVDSVRRECYKKGKSFLVLYPRGCRRLVALMRLPPELCSEVREDIVKEVVSMLSELFFLNRKKALILLSHYTKWIHLFKLHLEENMI